jgi:hypothetical protein
VLKGGASATFSGSNIVFTDATGHASATLTANTVAESYSVIATASGLSTPASFSLTNNSESPASVVAFAGTPQSTTVNSAFANTLKAVVREAYSNPTPGITVTFTVPASGASGAFSASSSVVTNSGGLATAPAFTANTIAGSYNVTASVSGVPTPASFRLTNNPGSAASIVATAGTPQSALPGAAYTTVLQAEVNDTFGNHVAGVSVTFAAPLSGASGTFSGRRSLQRAPMAGRPLRRSQPMRSPVPLP